MCEKGICLPLNIDTLSHVADDIPFVYSDTECPDTQSDEELMTLLIPDPYISENDKTIKGRVFVKDA